jgi:hypothetical protein
MMSLKLPAALWEQQGSSPSRCDMVFASHSCLPTSTNTLPRALPETPCRRGGLRLTCLFPRFGCCLRE